MKIETQCIQEGWKPQNGEPRVLPIYQSTTYKYDNSECMGDLFDLKSDGFFYTRLANPTVAAVENKLSALEGGVGAMLTSSGQAATTMAVMNIAQAGDNIVCSSAVYGGTFNLLGVTLEKFGIKTTFVNPNDDYETLSRAVNERTKLVLGETVSNPSLNVLDIEKFAKLAHDNNIPLIVDNTFATPYLCRPFEWGADIVIHSTSKYLDGHAVSLGGAVVDGGSFDWEASGKFPGLTEPDESYHGIVYTKSFGKAAYITKIRTQLMRDIGAMMSPQNAFLLNLGMETLHLRMPRHSENALAVAEFLENDPRVTWVTYPGLKSSPQKALTDKYLPNGASGVVSFGVDGGRKAAEKCLNGLRLAAIVTHVADARTCALHPASSTHRQLNDKQLAECGVKPELIRFSVGIENVDDIKADLDCALG